jgi:hypothetical protein
MVNLPMPLNPTNCAANETPPEPEPKENIQQEAPVEHEPLAPEEELGNSVSITCS